MSKKVPVYLNLPELAERLEMEYLTLRQRWRNHRMLSEDAVDEHGQPLWRREHVRKAKEYLSSDGICCEDLSGWVD